LDDVVHRIRRGEAREADYERLFREYRLALLRLLLIWGCPKPDAEELVQETMLRVYRSIEGFRFESSVHTWVLSIMGNVWKTYLKRRSAVPPMSSLEEPLKTDDDYRPSPPEPVAPGESPLELTLAAERRQRLREALDKLTPRVRQCMLLFLQGLKIEEIAQIQGVSSKTVKKQLREGRKRLRHLKPLIELFALSVVLILLLS
jgi:RNA polymerase sigma-70 factor (ECF subfamily)